MHHLTANTFRRSAKKLGAERLLLRASARMPMASIRPVLEKAPRPTAPSMTPLTTMMMKRR